MEFQDGEAQVYATPDERPDRDAGMTPVVCEVVEFKKNWAASAFPTYWIEVCFIPRFCVYFIRRRWNFPGHGGDVVVGAAKSSTTGSTEMLSEWYRTTVAGIMAKEYTALTRKAADWSPTSEVNLGKQVPPTRSLRAPVKRKAQKDWW